jgi:hypothetical protein
MAIRQALGMNGVGHSNTIRSLIVVVLHADPYAGALGAWRVHHYTLLLQHSFKSAYPQTIDNRVDFRGLFAGAHSDMLVVLAVFTPFLTLAFGLLCPYTIIAKTANLLLTSYNNCCIM